jgi:cation diffusion facilitator family transporter
MFSQLIETVFINKASRENPTRVESRKRYGQLGGWVSIVINILLFAIKLIVGTITGSFALVTDAVHTLSDCIGSILVIVSFRISAKPADREHPYGHGRVETVMTLLLIITGFEFFKSSLAKIASDSSVTVTTYLIVIVILSILIKEWMARFSIYLGKRIHSSTLIADAYHHRFDSLTTIVVLFSIIGAYYQVKWIDMIAAAVISVFIAYAGIDMLRKSVNPLLGEPPPDEILEEIEQSALSVKEVIGVHDIIAHQYGQQLIISFHIQVRDTLTANRIHEISEEVEDILVEKLNCHVTIHPDPINENHPRYPQIQKAIEEIIAIDDQLISFHDLRIIGGVERFTVLFDLSADCKRDAATINRITEQVREKLILQFPAAEFRITIEPAFAY